MTGTETAAPTAVAAMASVIVEPEKRSSMVVSLCFGAATVTDLCSRMLDISEEDLIQAFGALSGTERDGKYLELLSEIAPGLKRAAIMSGARF